MFLSGDFTLIPKNKKYLTKYFKTEVQRTFLAYFILFGTYENFVDHTGLYCQKRYLKILHDKMLLIEESHREAKQNLNLDILAEIENGKAKIFSRS